MVFATSPSSFSSLRPLVLRLSKVGAAYPIEVIVTVFCAVTLVYFQLLKVSEHGSAVVWSNWRATGSEMIRRERVGRAPLAPDEWRAMRMG